MHRGARRFRLQYTRTTMSPNEAPVAAILVVEDEMLVRMFAVDALEDAGFRVIQAGTAGRGFASAARIARRAGRARRHRPAGSPGR